MPNQASAKRSPELRRIALILLAIAAALAVAIWGWGRETRGASGNEGPPPGLGLVPSFAEEFDGGTLDTARWRTAFAPDTTGSPSIAKRSLWSNMERQVYFDKDFLGLGIDPFAIKGGILTVSAAPLDAKARAILMLALDEQSEKISNSALRNVAYSSGVISTRGSFAQKHGYFEIRAKWSGGKGLWPAFWLLPEDGSWPPEIDILEAHGDKPDVAFHSKHSKTEKSFTKRVPIGGTGQEFHRYGVLWTEQKLTFYIDGRETIAIPTPADFDQPMYPLANLAIGGSWPGDPDADTRFPATMDIDYIRVWQFSPKSTP